MITYYLYVKTHKITGLKYLGQTQRKNPYKYSGSGIRWTSHLDVHGCDIDTQILKVCYSKVALKSWGLFYSKLWSVTSSKKWANLKDECGDGGCAKGTNKGNLAWNKGLTKDTDDRVANQAITQRGIPSPLKGTTQPKSVCDKRSKTMTGSRVGKNNPMHGRIQTGASKIKEKLTGKSKSKNHCQNIKNSALNRPKISCLSCRRVMTINGFNGTHRC